MSTVAEPVKAQAPVAVANDTGPTPVPELRGDPVSPVAAAALIAVATSQPAAGNGLAPQTTTPPPAPAVPEMSAPPTPDVPEPAAVSSPAPVPTIAAPKEAVTPPPKAPKRKSAAELKSAAADAALRESVRLVHGEHPVTSRQLTEAEARQVAAGLAPGLAAETTALAAQVKTLADQKEPLAKAVKKAEDALALAVKGDVSTATGEAWRAKLRQDLAVATQRHAAVADQQVRTEGRLRKATADAATLVRPDASFAAIAVLLASRVPNISVAPGPPEVRKEASVGLDPTKPLARVSRTTTSRTEVINGVAHTVIDVESLTWDLGGQLTKDKSRTVAFTSKEGSRQVKTGSSTGGGVNVVGQIGYQTTTYREEKTVTHDDYDRATVDKHTVTNYKGTGGAYKTVVDAKSKGGQGNTTTTLYGVSRSAAGAFGWKALQTVIGPVDPGFRSLLAGKTVGAFGPDGKPRPPGAAPATSAISVKSDDGKSLNIGLGGTPKQEVKKYEAGKPAPFGLKVPEGLSRSQTLGGDVNLGIAIREGTGEPTTYTFETTLVGLVRGGIGGSIDRGEAPGRTSSGTLTASATVSLSLKWSHTMSEDEAQDYLDEIGVAATGQGQAGGRHKEIALIRAAAHGGLAQLKTAAKSFGDLTSLVGSASRAKHLAEGDSVELGGDVKGELGLSLGTKRGPVGVSGEVSGSRSAGSKLRVAKRREGIVAITAEINTAQTLKLSVSGQYYVTVTASEDLKRAHSRSITVEIDSERKDYEAMYHSILEAFYLRLNPLEALRDLLNRQRDLNPSETESETRDSATALSVSLVLLKASGTIAAQTYDEVTHGADGAASTKVKGSSTGTLDAAVAAQGVSSSNTDVFEGTASLDPTTGKHSKSAKVTQTGAASSAAKTAATLGGRWESLAVGGQLAASAVDVSGIYLSDEDLQTIIERATDDDAGQWIQSLPDATLIKEWLAVRAQIRKNPNDAANLLRALRSFSDTQTFEDRGAVIINTVRRGGHGGARFQFPEGLGNLAARYEALVAGKPIAAAQLKASGGGHLGAGRQGPAAPDPEGAVRDLNAAIVRLESIAEALHSGQDKFSSRSTQAEMYGSVRTLQSQMQAEVSLIGKATTGVGASPTAIRGWNTIEGIRSTLLNNKAQEKALFAKLDAEYHKQGHSLLRWLSANRPADPKVVAGLLNQLTELRGRWIEQLASANKLAMELLGAPFITADVQPDTARFHYYHELWARESLDSAPVYDLPVAFELSGP